MLFFEIMLIRWLSAEIRIFAYFHNLVLLFAFLGIGLGAIAARREREVPLLLSLAIAAGLVILVSAHPYLGPFSLKNLSYLLSAGTGFLIWGGPQLTDPVYRFGALVAGALILLLISGLLTLLFVPFGQLLGRQFEAYDRPLRAYGLDLAGSMAGVLAFAALSAQSFSPTVWFGLGSLACLPLIRGWPGRVAGAGLGLLCAVVLLLPGSAQAAWTLWSPYQKLEVNPTFLNVDAPGGKKYSLPYGAKVDVNSTEYLQIANYTDEMRKKASFAFPPDVLPYDHYNLPYRFAGRLDHVLIVGAGAGNDTAGALRNGARRVTAVEIDPKIIQIGERLHPERPFQDSRVRLINNDARTFFRNDRGRYDLVVFGLLDSHTLSSSYSNVRLDNYVYTVESLREARRLLGPEGVMVLIFQVADPFIGERFHRIFEEALGQRPITFEVRSGFRGWGGHGFVGGNLDTIRARVAADPRLRQVVERGASVEKGWAEPGTSVEKGRAETGASVEKDRAETVEPSTDDWPYLYLRDRAIPLQYWLIFGLLALFSLGGLRLAEGRKPEIDWHFFFLGAGFMLLEVQNISKMALIFGTTWVVNTVAISAVLVTILAANVLAALVKPKNLLPWYGALAASLVMNFVVPPSIFVGLPELTKLVLSGAIYSLPIFFAGVVFSSSFRQADNRSAMLGSNLVGAMAGGMVEALSFVFGLKALLVVALVIYAMSLALRRRGQSVLAPGTGI